MKTYTGIELLQAIRNEEIKGGTKIEVHDLSVLDRVVTVIQVNERKGLEWKNGEFDTSMLLNDYYYFKPIEEPEEIDIQAIEELREDRYFPQWKDEAVCQRERLNLILKAVKQIERQLNNR